MGMSVKLMPGVRIGLSSRGLRVSGGPRIARVHVGAGRTGVSTGFGPIGAFTGLGGKRRKSSSSSRASARPHSTAAPPPAPSTFSQEDAAVVAAIEGIAQLGASGASAMAELARRAVAGVRAEAAQKAAQRASQQAEAEAFARRAVQDFNEQLLRMATLHHESFVRASPPRAEAPPVDEHAIREQCLFEAKASTSALSGRRRAAMEEASRRADFEIQIAHARRSERLRIEQTRLEKEWNDLLANEPIAVLNALEDAFEDNESPAVTVNCEGDEVAIIVTVAGALPPIRPSITKKGRLQNSAWDAKEAAEFYLTALASSILATVKEVWTAAPSIRSATIIAIAQREKFEIDGLLSTVVLYRGTFTRERHERLAWTHIDPIEVIAAADDVDLVRRGRVKGVQPLSLKKHTDLRDLLNQIEEALEPDHGQGAVPHQSEPNDASSSTSLQSAHGSPAGGPMRAGALPPQGWYCDPWDRRPTPQRQRRWWDGDKWTAHVRGEPLSPPADEGA